jgi:glycosyltransferase involved in cell wall biosynthesis
MVSASFLPLTGGMEWKVHHLATEYGKRGHDVTVFTCRAPRAMKTTPLPAAPDYRVIRCSFQFPGIDRIRLSEFLFRRAILGHHRLQPFDVLHCHHLGLPTRFGVTVKLLTGVPVVATTCGGDVMVLPEAEHGDRLKPRFDRIVRFNLKHVDVVGSINESIRADLEKMQPDVRIVDIPNGVPWDAFQIRPSRLLHQELGLDERAIIVLSVGRNRPVKGYAVGIQAFAQIATRFPDAVYVLVGKGMSTLLPQVSRSGLDNRIRLVEQVAFERIPTVFRSADLFFSPSFMEGFSQVNAQALASGLPCVFTDAPGNLDAGRCGGAIIARSGDSDSMATALAELLADESLRQRLGAEAHEAGKLLAWSRIAEEYLDIFVGLTDH